MAARRPHHRPRRRDRLGPELTRAALVAARPRLERAPTSPDGSPRRSATPSSPSSGAQQRPRCRGPFGTGQSPGASTIDQTVAVSDGASGGRADGGPYGPAATVAPGVGHLRCRCGQRRRGILRRPAPKARRRWGPGRWSCWTCRPSRTGPRRQPEPLRSGSSATGGRDRGRAATRVRNGPAFTPE